ncbi:helix-loop-helix DNA-binding domain-containing protein [Lipomyces kononenkoae]|uniref:Helix-loop-helix DNA-binding domain-containing protein n=1 Tax=Lipomyces kononenkoae TaxID=34357 RepID=A0ACC3TBQ2_LIPKO
MSYKSPPFIKPDPDSMYYGAGAGGYAPTTSSVNPELMSREMLTRGFSSFDDGNLSSSMIPEADLLDFEGLDGADINYNDVNGPGFERVAPIGNAGNNHSGLTGPQNLDMGSYLSPSSRHVNMTPPVPSSTSPFDDFMAQQRPIPQKLNNGNSRPLRPESHTQRFLYDNDYIPKQQSNLQSVSVPESSSWNTPPGSFDQGFSSPPPTTIKGLGSSLPHGDTDKQQLLMMEKRRRRRESHNAVERRRRDNINEKIQELASLIPEHLLAGTGFSSGGSGGAGVNSGSFGTEVSTPGGTASTPSAAAAAAAGKDGKPNKGIILRKSVDYIRQLQTILEEQRRRNEELERKVQKLEEQQGIVSQPSTLHNLPTNRDAITADVQSADHGMGVFDQTPASSNDNNDDFNGDFDYDDNVFQASPQQLSDNDRGYNGMDLS